MVKLTAADSGIPQNRQPLPLAWQRKSQPVHVDETGIAVEGQEEQLVQCQLRAALGLRISATQMATLLQRKHLNPIGNELSLAWLAISQAH